MIHFIHSVGRINRANVAPPEPYRSQSIAVTPNGQRNARPASSLPAQPISRARSSRPLGDSLRSAVLETSILSIAKRPDAGGTGIEATDLFCFAPLVRLAGRRSQLLTNHFRCGLPRHFHCHQYDIELEVPNRDGSWRPAKKETRFLVLQMLSEREKFPLVWYDEGKSLYSIDLLIELKDQYEIVIKETKIEREQKYRLRIIKLVKSYDIQVRSIERRERERERSAMDVL